MSDRALIAFETSTGTFDLHHSHNGAGEIGQLLALLESYHKKRDPKRPGTDMSFTDLSGVTGEQAMQRRAMESEARSTGYESQNFADQEDAIRANPEHVEVPKGEIGDHFDFVEYEALLTVEDSEAVTLYAPIWLEPGPLTFLRQNVLAEVYEAESPTMPPQMVFQTDPEYSLQGDEYLKAVEEEDSTQFQELRYMHRGMVQMALAGRHRALSEGTNPSEITAMVTYGSQMVRMGLQNVDDIHLSNPTGFGVFVEVPRMTMDDLSGSDRREFDAYMDKQQSSMGKSEPDDPPEVVTQLTQHFQKLNQIKRDADRQRLRINREVLGDTQPHDDGWESAHKAALVEFIKFVESEHGDHLVTWTPSKFSPLLEKLVK